MVSQGMDRLGVHTFRPILMMLNSAIGNEWTLSGSKWHSAVVEVSSRIELGLEQAALCSIAEL